MKSMASSIQPAFAASSTRHCSRVTVRYHGTSSTAPPVRVAPADASRGSMRGGAYQRRQRTVKRHEIKARAAHRARGTMTGSRPFIPEGDLVCRLLLEKKKT